MPPRGLPVTVRRPGGYNQHGDPLPSTEHTVNGCSWAPRSAHSVGGQSERTDMRETVTVGYTLFGPFGMDVRATDQVIIAGLLDDDGSPLVWQVDGEVGRWESPYDMQRVGAQVALKRWEG